MAILDPGMLRVQAILGRPLTDAEILRYESLYDSLINTLELWLNRDLEVRTYTNERHIAPTPSPYGSVLTTTVQTAHVLIPFHEPVITMLAMKDADGGDVFSGDDLRRWDTFSFGPGTEVFITYTAGTDIEAYPQIEEVIANAIAKTYQLGPQMSTGAITGYSVEGTSITYGVPSSAAGGTVGMGNVGKISVADLSSLRRLKRRVVR